jgi:hypothetical protein
VLSVHGVFLSAVCAGQVRVKSTQTATNQSGRSLFGQLDADPAGVLALLEDPQLSDAAVCTHGELIGQVLTPTGRRRIGG